jgi:hypothetical protein
VPGRCRRISRFERPLFAKIAEGIRAAGWFSLRMSRHRRATGGRTGARHVGNQVLALRSQQWRFDLIKHTVRQFNAIESPYYYLRP